jgi:hypothetical protein
MTTTITAVQGTRINHGLLIRLNVNGTIYRLANTYNPLTWNGESYTALGHFLGISEIQEDLRATNNSITVSLSGIPSDVSGEPNYIGLMLQEPIKGSRIQIYRAFFDPDTRQLLANQVFLRFSGYVSTFTLAEGNNQFEKDSTNTITIQCANINAIIERRIGGRRTNAADFGTDTGMYRVTTIANRSFDFGKPYVAPTNPTEPGGGDNSFIESPGA